MRARQELEPAVLGKAGVDGHHQGAHAGLGDAALVVVAVV